MPHLFPPLSLACLLFSLAPPTTSHGFSHRKRQTATEWVFFFLFFLSCKALSSGQPEYSWYYFKPMAKNSQEESFRELFFYYYYFQSRSPPTWRSAWFKKRNTIFNESPVLLFEPGASPQVVMLSAASASHRGHLYRTRGSISHPCFVLVNLSTGRCRRCSVANTKT